MRKFLILAAVLLAIPSLAQAKKKTGKGEVFVTPQVTIPVGEFADGAGVGIGATLGASYQLMPKLDLTGRLGYNYHFPKTTENIDYTVTTIPVLLGLQYELIPNLYGLLELGYITMDVSTEVGGVTISADNGEFGGNVGVGYDFGPVMGTAMLTTPNLTGDGDPLWGILIGAQIPFFNF